MARRICCRSYPNATCLTLLTTDQTATFLASLNSRSICVQLCLLALDDGCIALQVVAGFIYLIEDESRMGTILLLHSQLGKAFEWHEPRGNLKHVPIPALDGKGCILCAHLLRLKSVYLSRCQKWYACRWLACTNGNLGLAGWQQAPEQNERLVQWATSNVPSHLRAIEVHRWAQPGFHPMLRMEWRLMLLQKPCGVVHALA